MITHHMSPADIVNLILIFGGDPLPDWVDGPGYYMIDGVCYPAPAWIEELL